MRVVITGGTGSIGPAIASQLRQFGHEPIVVSRSPVEAQDGITHIQADYYAPGFRDLIKSQNPGAIISMITFDDKDARVLLQACPDGSHLVFISSVYVSGRNFMGRPTSEDDELKPFTAYGIGKAEAERALYAQRRVPVTTFRLASTVGPSFPVLRQLEIDPSGRWIRRMLAGMPIVVADNGLQKWSWCAASDSAVAIAASIGRETCYGHCFNLTREEPITWLDYHKRVASVLGRESELVHIPSHAIVASDLPCRLLREQSQWDQVFIIEKLKRHLPEFNPRVGFEEMIDRCLANVNRQPASGDEPLNCLEDNLIEAWSRRPELWID